MPIASRHAEMDTHRSASVALEFDTFSAELMRELQPVGRLERVIADRVVLAAWRLQRLTADETSASLQPDRSTSLDLATESGYAITGLDSALSLLRDARASRLASIAPPRRAVPVDPDHGPDADLPNISNEWTPIERPAPGPCDDESPDDREPFEPCWTGRLVFDLDVSSTTPVVRGTWITVRQVVSLIVDGWSWSDVLRAHPELTEDDVRACLAYTVEQDDGAEV